MNDATTQTPAAQVQLTLKRDFTGDRLNRVLAHPDVRKWIAPWPAPEGLDAGVLAADARNVVLMSDHGGAVFVALDEAGTAMELHTNFLPEARGRPVVGFMHEALAYVFTQTWCLEVLTKIPSHNHAARALAHHFRFDLDAVRADAWVLDADGATSDLEFYGYRWSDWIRHSPLLAAMGAMFHQQLHDEFERLNLGVPQHPDEVWHDRVVGATLATAYAGMVDKALTLYNRWARFAGYAGVRLVSRSPVIVEFEAIPVLRLVLDPVARTFEVLPPRAVPGAIAGNATEGVL